jgi:flagellar export protein FliJ
MKADPLQSILRVRQSTLDEAQKALADAYVAEQLASRQVAEATEALDLELRAAMSLVAGDDAVESFARWLPVGRKRVTDAYNAQKESTATLDRLRAVLALARAGVRSVETLIENKQRETDMVAQRKEQQVLDDIGSLRRAE